MRRQIILVEKLLADIHTVARGQFSHEYSVSHAGQVAVNFLAETKSDLDQIISS